MLAAAQDATANHPAISKYDELGMLSPARWAVHMFRSSIPKKAAAPMKATHHIISCDADGGPKSWRR